MIKTLLMWPEDKIKNGKNIPLVTTDSGLFRKVKVNMSSVPEGAERIDALECGYFDISPYWQESYTLVMDKNGVVHYKSVK